MELTETDLKILDIARRLFLEQGIMNTEMKDIATEMGCSRSTLYRHFANKSDILLILAQNAVELICDSVRIPKSFQFVTGYDAFNWQMNSMMEMLILHTDEVTFLRDFDCVYTKSYPMTHETENFLHLVSNPALGDAMRHSLLLGIEDGSIRNIDNIELLLLTLTHGCIALAQRVLPREQLFISEHGYGQEMLRNYVKLSMESIQA